MKRLALIISYLFHPLILFLVMPYLILNRQYSSMYAFKWVMFSSLFTSVAVAMILVGRAKGFFSDDDISRKEERYRFFHFAIVLGVVYLAAALFFKGSAFPLSIVAFGILFGIICFDLINHVTKASIHVGVACAFVITTSVLYKGHVVFFLAWMIPLVIWSRLFLKRHTGIEAIAGGTLGSIVTVLTLYLGKLFYS